MYVQGASKHLPNIWRHPNIWGHQNMWAHPNNWGSQMYGAYENPLVSQSMLSLCCVCPGGIQTSSKHIGASKHMGTSKYVDTSKQLGQSNVRGIWKPLSVTNHAFFVLCIYRRHPNIFQTYQGIQTYGGHRNIWPHPNNRGSQIYGAYGNPLV